MERFINKFEIFLSTLTMLLSVGTLAQTIEPVYEFNISPIVYHWNPGEEVKTAWLIGIESRQNSNLMGIAYFKNSYNQSSGLVYPLGKQYIYPLDQYSLFANWRFGVIYSYRGKYKDKVPYVFKGWLPVFLPSIGVYLTDKIKAETIFIINEAVMINFSMRI